MKKRILYIGNKLSSSVNNETSIFKLGSLLESEGHILYYASNKNNQILRLIDMLQTVYKLKKTVTIVLLDVYSTRNFYYSLLVSQLCRLLHLKYIPILRGGNLPHRLKQSPRLSKMLFNHAHVNIAPSHYLKDAFEAAGYTNIKHIPNTMVLQDYPFSVRPLETPKLLWVRSFAALYNPTLAVKVLKSLHDKGWKAELCMVGPDSDGTLAEVKALANTLNVEVKFTGKLTKPEWTALAKDYNVFINTTNFDNTPVSVMEAMALGLPIVSTNVGGMPYLIDHGVDGLLVPPNDVDAMVNAIIQLYENPSKREVLVANARQKVEGFDWEVVKQQWQSVLRF